MKDVFSIDIDCSRNIYKVICHRIITKDKEVTTKDREDTTKVEEDSEV